MASAMTGRSITLAVLEIVPLPAKIGTLIRGVKTATRRVRQPTIAMICRLSDRGDARGLNLLRWQRVLTSSERSTRLSVVVVALFL